MIHGFLACGLSLILTFSSVCSPGLPLLFCSQVFTVFPFTRSSLLMIMVAALTVCFLLQTWQLLCFFCFEPVLPQPHQFSSHPVSSKGRCLLCLLSTGDNNLFSFPFIFLVCNEAGSESCGKTSISLKFLPSLHSQVYFAPPTWCDRPGLFKSTTKAVCFHFVQLLDSPAFLCYLLYDLRVFHRSCHHFSFPFLSYCTAC